MSDLKKNYVLVLNSVWAIIGYTSIQKAIISMYSTNNGENMAAMALDLDFGLDENGFVDFTNCTKMIPVGIPEWNSLGLRDFDIPIRTSHSVVRAPIVLITKNYAKMNYRRLRPTKRNLYDFYNKKCIWTGRELSLGEASIEHIQCRSAKGDSTWQNLAISDKKLNSERGNLPLEKWKHKMQYQLKEPKAMPVCALINKPIRPEWTPFLLK